tara:strand:- start:973 stop:1677 length:705 start_codon:yes stop_codon:yes gene_type:complete
MSYIIESKQVGRFTATTWAETDLDLDLDWALGEEPVLVFSTGRHRAHVLLDGSKTLGHDFDLYKNLEDEDWAEACWALDGSADFDVLEDGRIRLDSGYLARPRYFKTGKSAAHCLAREVSGLDLEDVKIERISTRDSEVFTVWLQSELDKYAGAKKAKFHVGTLQALLDGEVYGFSVEDEDGDVLESCGGFIGDADYCMAEAEAVAVALESEAMKRDAEVLEASRADLYAVASK